MPRRISQLLIGLVLYGVADALMIRAVLGVDPWTVLSQGLSVHTGLGIGVLTNIVGVLVLLLWIPLRQRPGVGTVLNILIIGPSIELGLWLVPPMTELWAQILMFAAGLVLLAVASGLYIGARMGPGPRDGLMTGLAARGHSLRVVRTGIEITVLAAGWALGGTVGVGTVAYALAIGPLAHVFVPLFTVADRRAPALAAA